MREPLLTTKRSTHPTALEMMAEHADMLVGNTDIAERQPLLTPGWRFGLQLEGTKNALRDKKLLVFGAGDIWFKFIRWVVDHLGIKEENITVIEKDNDCKPDPRLKWQFGNIEIITQDEIKKDPSVIKSKNFDFAIVLTPPGLHLDCVKQSFELGIPVLVEKPAFISTQEYDEFDQLQKEKNIPAYFIDWGVPLAATFYAALGHKIPFADSVEFKNKDKFAEFNINDLASVEATFVEGRGNAVAAAGHRVYLKDVRQGGMLSDLGAHAIQVLTVLGFKLEKVNEAILGKPSKNGQLGVYERIGHEDVPDDQKTAEWYARVKANMSLGEQKNVLVLIEAGKLAFENDMRIELKDKKGNLLKYELGHQTSEVTLSDNQGNVLAQAKGKGDPYAFIFMQANRVVDDWKTRNKAIAAYGPECREMIKFVEYSHMLARGQKLKEGTLAKQLALEGNQTLTQPQTIMRAAKKIEHITQYKIVGEKYWTAEGPVFDQKSGCFWWTDIENGLLVRYDTAKKESTTWKLTANEMDMDGRPKQMIGGTTAVNADGSVLVILDAGGPNAGLNYFDPETGGLYNVGKMPAAEQVGAHSRNRPNDSTMITIGGRTHLLIGTMSKDWHSICNPDGSFKRLGSYYLIDGETLEWKPLKFDTGIYSAPLITNGLTDCGDMPDGKKILFWSETVENPGELGKSLNVYRGLLDPETLKVSDIKIFKNHTELGGSLNGKDTFGRADGANMAMYNDGKHASKLVYGVAVLETGILKFFDVENGESVLDIKLPTGATLCTKFALGKDNDGDNIALVTTLDGGYHTRRKGAQIDGLNGSVITFKLPKGLEPHPQTMARVDYPGLKTLIDKPTAAVELGRPIFIQPHIAKVR